MSSKKGRPNTPARRVPPKVSTPGRPVLGTLQQDAKNPQILVGLNSSRLNSPAITKKKKDNSGLRRDSTSVPPAIKPKTTETATQTEQRLEDSIHYRMCTQEEPPVEYWQEMAEQRRLALAQTLQENEQLYHEIDRLKGALEKMQSARDDADYFSFLYELSKSEQP